MQQAPQSASNATAQSPEREGQSMNHWGPGRARRASRAPPAPRLQGEEEGRESIRHALRRKPVAMAATLLPRADNRQSTPGVECLQ